MAPEERGRQKARQRRGGGSEQRQRREEAESKDRGERRQKARQARKCVCVPKSQVDLSRVVWEKMSDDDVFYLFLQI
jgi:hypothetical protein